MIDSMLTNDDFNEADLFDPYHLRDHSYLAARVFDYEGVESIALDDEVLTCKRCGALVLDNNTDAHLRWHYTIEAR